MRSPFNRLGRNKPPYCLQRPSTLSTLVPEIGRITVNQTSQPKQQHLKSFRSSTSQGHPRLSKIYIRPKTQSSADRGGVFLCTKRCAYVGFTLAFSTHVHDISLHIPSFLFPRHSECCTYQLHHRSILQEVEPGCLPPFLEYRRKTEKRTRRDIRSHNIQPK